MGLKKWIQRKICDLTWGVISHIDKDVIEEFADDMSQRMQNKVSMCSCSSEDMPEDACDNTTRDHECTCMTSGRLKTIEQEWVERGIIR